LEGRLLGYKVIEQMRPENAPVLKGKCAREFVKQTGKPLSKEQLSIFKEADRVFEAIKQKK
jgi:hypothetical protein